MRLQRRQPASPACGREISASRAPAEPRRARLGTLMRARAVASMRLHAMHAIAMIPVGPGYVSGRSGHNVSIPFTARGHHRPGVTAPPSPSAGMRATPCNTTVVDRSMQHALQQLGQSSRSIVVLHAWVAQTTQECVHIHSVNCDTVST